MPTTHDEIIEFYKRHGGAWARDRGDRLFETAWLDRFRVLMPGRGRVLDLGCGSGEPVARYLLENGCVVTGVDAVPEMVAKCRLRFKDQRWLVADIRTLAMDEVFDGLLAWNSFFHLSHDDQRGMFAVLRSHAAPGAALMFTSGPSHGEAIGCYAGERLYHASLAPTEYRLLLKEHGFEVIMHIAEDPDCAGHTVWLAQARQ